MQLVAEDPEFAAIRDQLDGLLEPHRFIGRAPQQVDEFLANEFEPRVPQAMRGAAADELRV